MFGALVALLLIGLGTMMLARMTGVLGPKVSNAPIFRTFLGR